MHHIVDLFNMIPAVVTVVAIFTMDHVVDVFNMILAVVTVVAIFTMDHIVEFYLLVIDAHKYKLLLYVT
jgi:hypothetical protein